MDLENQKVLVVGLGKSGMAAYELLKNMGAKVSLFDGKKDLDVSGYDAPVFLGKMTKEELAGFACAVFSPGVPLDIDLASELRELNIPIIGEIELAFLCEKGVVAGITGTNGKTTTTTLVGEIMKAYKEKVFVVGNIGNPYTKEVEKSAADSVTVAEISSFQLETIDTFHPVVSAVLNITPDHLNRHKTMEEYIRVKLSITKNQTKEDLCVLNYEDEVLRDSAKEMPCEVTFFSSKQKIANGLYQNDNKDIVDAKTGEVLMNMSECNLPGDHNCENIMAAILITRKLGVPMDTILSVVKKFQAVEHRVEFVKTVRGVDYYNDSKGTNPDAAIKGIQSMSKPTVLIGGGYDKQSEYDEWIESFGGKVKLLVLIGQTREKVAACARAHGFENSVLCDTFEEAIDTCYRNAVSGDAVLLSPACASWGMFKNYEERGRIFKEYVRALKED